MAATKSEQDMGHVVAAGGNLEPGNVFDPATGTVQKMDAETAKRLDQESKDEADAAKQRADAIARSKMPVANAPVAAP